MTLIYEIRSVHITYRGRTRRRGIVKAPRLARTLVLVALLLQSTGRVERRRGSADVKERFTVAQVLVMNLSSERDVPLRIAAVLGSIDLTSAIKVRQDALELPLSQGDC